MGVDTNLHLPYGTKLRNVARASAILLGAPKTWYDLDTKTSQSRPTAHGWVEIEGIKLVPASEHSEGCYTIDLSKVNAPLAGNFWLFYHMEATGGPYLSGGSRAERICFHVELAKVFGGKVVYNDCYSKVNFRRPAPKWLGKESNAAFHACQLAIWNLEPITPEIISKFVKHAAYGK